MEGVVLALVVCLLLALITKRLSLPTIPFYIIAGLLIGTSGLNLVGSDDISLFLTELGLLFLLFFMGLEIKPDKIWKNQSAILTSGVIDLNVNMIIGFVVAYALGFSLFDSLVVAAAFFISSTAMALTSLVENRKLLMRESETIVWLMIFEDIVLIILLAALGSSMDNPIFLVLKLAAVLSVLYLIIRIAREYIATLLKRDDELPVLLTFSAVLGIAALSESIGIPVSFVVIAFGAMLGTIDTESFEVHSRPFKDVFLVVFFVFFGITTNLFTGGISLLAIIAISILAILSKFISGMVIGRVIHRNTSSGIEIWSNTIARGEFSIAIAALYGSPVISGTIATMVIVTSVVGAFAARYSNGLKRLLLRTGREIPSPRVSIPE
ncbi:MAG: cation:proton antiporter [Methanoregulaceae archaeon]|nr:cation:proton antiporter [Methanoregulaceae archaeon]